MMISRSKINLGKKLSIPQLVQEVIYPQQRVLVLDYHGIQIPVVNAHPHGTIFLLHKQDRGTPW
jgi:hypothetical protein